MMRRFCVAAAVVLVAWCMPVDATEKKEEPTPIEQMHRALLEIQQNITGSNVKLRRNLTGTSPSLREGETRRPATPAEECCLPHIENITRGIRKLTRIAGQLDARYAEQQHAQAGEQLGLIRTELITIARGTAVFKMAGTKARAGEALQGLIRPFNRLRKSVEELEACCPLENAAP